MLDKKDVLDTTLKHASGPRLLPGCERGRAVSVRQLQQGVRVLAYFKTLHHRLLQCKSKNDTIP